MDPDLARDILTARALRVPVDPVHPDPEILLNAATIIRQGGVVSYPTETFYGLAVNPFDAKAVARLFAVKGRPVGRPMILLLARPGQVLDLAPLTGLRRQWCDRLTRAFWPGALTLVLPARARLNCPALAGGDTVAVRISSHPVAWQLASTTGLPITSTSANPSGGQPAASADAIEPALAARLDLILDAGPTPGGLASTILDLTGDRPMILRQGRVTVDQIAQVLAVRPRVGQRVA